MEHKVIWVDETDTPLGELEKMEAHRLGILHRAVSVFVFNTEGKLLLQQRASNKYHSSSLWTNTACTHPYPGETNEEAAHRRLEEEMGLRVKQVTKLFDFTYREALDNQLTEHEFDHVFVAFSDNDPTPHPDEVADFSWVDPVEMLKEMERNPDRYTVWFRNIAVKVIALTSR